MTMRSPTEMLYLVAATEAPSAFDVRVGSMPASAASVKVTNSSLATTVTNTIDVSAATTIPVETQNTVATSTTLAVSTLLKPYGTVVAGLEEGTAASTAYQCASAGQACISVAFKAHPSNSGNVFIGSTTVSGASEGFPLDAGEALSLRVSNVNLVYYWCSTANDRLGWIVLS